MFTLQHPCSIPYNTPVMLRITHLQHPITHLQHPYNSQISFSEHRKFHESDRASVPVSLFVKRRLLQQAIECQHSSTSPHSQPHRGVSSSDRASLGPGPGPGPFAVSSAERDFERRVASGCHTVNSYEDPNKQAVARYSLSKTHLLACCLLTYSLTRAYLPTHIFAYIFARINNNTHTSIYIRITFDTYLLDLC